jgi:hypothetical protein
MKIEKKEFQQPGENHGFFYRVFLQEAVSLELISSCFETTGLVIS